MNEQEKYEWMVFVRCFTYNQAQYIEDAMNGFTMQETNFPFVCAVVDDASTDGEQEVIKSYLNEHFDLEDKNVVRHEDTDDYVMTFARHKTNINCFFAVYFLKYNHYKKKSKGPYLAQWREKARYTAMCEGDDYWTDKHKLQLQVDEIGKHDEVDICAHTTVRMKNNMVHGYIRPIGKDGIIPIEKVISGGGRSSFNKQFVTQKECFYHLERISKSNGWRPFYSD